MHIGMSVFRHTCHKLCLHSSMLGLTWREWVSMNLCLHNYFMSGNIWHLTPPPFRLLLWQAAGGCCAASALCVSVIQLTRPRQSAFARGWTVRLWWPLCAVRIRPPIPMSASWRKPSATRSDASRCYARDPAVSNITVINSFILGEAIQFNITANPISTRKIILLYYINYTCTFIVRHLKGFSQSCVQSYHEPQ